MNDKYTVRAHKIETAKWKAKYLTPRGSLTNDVVMLPDAQFPYFEILFMTEEEANQAAYKYLIGKGVKTEDIEVKILGNWL